MATRAQKTAAALKYEKMGLSVIPLHGVNPDGSCTCDAGQNCSSPGKHPRINWSKYQSERATPKKIRGWLKYWPNSNIGIITGALSGIIVLDVDGPEGEKTLRDGNLRVPCTVTVKTGGGGWHYWFKHPGFECRNFAGKIGKTILHKVDFRGDGGQTATVPSSHRSGNFYEFILSPEETEIAPAPEWLLELIKQQSATAGSNGVSNKASINPEEWEVAIPQGQRNDQLTRRAGSLLAKKIPPSEVFTIIQAINEKHCSPPLPGKEVEVLVSSIAKADERKNQSKKSSSNAEKTGDEEKEKTSQADILIKIAAVNAYLFHDETMDAFANITIKGHRETWPTKSKFFKHWLVRQYYEQTKKSPTGEAVRQALNVIEAKAIFDGAEHKLSLRVAEHGGSIYYDLANDAWQAVRITSAGWEVADKPPIIFRRFKNTAAQVMPERGGSLELFKKYINFKNECDWMLMYAVSASFFIPGIPHPIPIFYGDKGSAKTTAQRVIRKIVDPAHRDTMTLPTDKNELALLLMTNYAPCFDNLDGLQQWQSDMLCQAATGGGISKRELYSDMDEVILSFLRCPMLNGINLVASRDDLLDRSILFRLERIKEEKRMEESIFWKEFEKDRPFILGALLDAIAIAKRIYPHVKMKRLPRMADFARWGYAVNEAISGNGKKFIESYYQNIAGAVEEAILADQVSAAIIAFMNEKTEWEGTATNLLEKLNEIPGVDIKAKTWPKRAHTLTKRLNKMKSALSDYGVSFETWRNGTTRGVTLKKHGHDDAHDDACGFEASLSEPRWNRHRDDSDADDASAPTLSNGKKVLCDLDDPDSLLEVEI